MKIWHRSVGIKSMNIIDKICIKIEELLSKSSIITEIDGIKICDIRKNEKRNDTDYLKTIVSSIDLIRNVDPKRYKTFRNEVSWITTCQIDFGAAAVYRRINKSCVINFVKYHEDEMLECVQYAAILVHEATHGLLETKGFDSKKNRILQIERICTTEANRFLRKVENVYPGYGDILKKEFNPLKWNYFWNTPKWKKIYHGIKQYKKEDWGELGSDRKHRDKLA